MIVNLCDVFENFRIFCVRIGGIYFIMSGYNFMNLVFVINVGGMGDV